MIRTAWRQFRMQAVIAGGLLVAVAIVVLASGAHLADLYEATVATCAQHHDCSSATEAFLRSNRFLQGALPPVLLVAPAVIGVFWGAPLVARELETGTFRLAWTQSVTRRRWLSTKVTLLGLASAIVVGLLSLLETWWFSPIDRVYLNRFSPSMFGVRGIAPVGYALFGFALGVALGVIVRRTLPAMALTIIGFIGARLAMTYWVRPRLAGPLDVTAALTMAEGGPGSQLGAGSVPAGSWVLSDQTVNGGGQVVGQAGGMGPNGELGLHVAHGGTLSIPGAGSCPGIHLHVGTPHAVTPANQGVARAFDACARHLGLHQVLTYQPLSRYWPFQWAEAAIFLALALMLAWFCLWWLVGRPRRMTSRARQGRMGVRHAPMPGRAALGQGTGDDISAGVERAPQLRSTATRLRVVGRPAGGDPTAPRGTP